MMNKASKVAAALPSLAALGGRSLTTRAVREPVDIKHVSPQTLNKPRKEGAEALAKRQERKARRKRRMKLRAHRGRGCAG